MGTRLPSTLPEAVADLAAARGPAVEALAISTAKTYISLLATAVPMVAMAAANMGPRRGRERQPVNLAKLLAICIPAVAAAAITKEVIMALVVLAAAQTAGKAQQPTLAAEPEAETDSIKFSLAALASLLSATIGKEDLYELRAD